MNKPTFSDAACTWDTDEDKLLVQRFQKGDAQAFTELVVRYQKPVFQAAFWVLRNGEDASDIAQNVFLKAAQHIDDYDPRYKFFSWIYRIAINEALNMQRQRHREEALDEDFDAPAPDSANPQWQLDAAQRERALRGAVMKLSADHRAVITLRHFQECSYQEMAQMLDVDEGTVKSRLFEARQRLRTLLATLEDKHHGRH